MGCVCRLYGTFLGEGEAVWTGAVRPGYSIVSMERSGLAGDSPKLGYI